MKGNNIEKLRPYRVTSPSSDETFQVNDLIWKCENGDIMLPKQEGRIDRRECENPNTFDFEAELDENYCILAVNGSESMIPKKLLTTVLSEYKGEGCHVIPRV